jgi:hypothetical protein
MTTPSGQISLNDVNVELGIAGTTLITMNDANVRTLAGVGGSGTTISMQNLQNKSNQFSFTISSNQTNANLRTLAISAGWNQTTKLVATIGPSVYLSSNSTGTPGLTISGSFPGGVDLINNGFIIGMGGNGGQGRSGSAQTGGGSGGSAGSGGGLALSVSSPVSITNNQTIGGGGGGGGGGQAAYNSAGTSKLSYFGAVGAGGGGGGRTGTTNSSGGGGGTGTGPQPGTYSDGSTGGAGTSSGAGGGGSGGSTGPFGFLGPMSAGPGGAGGGWGSSGSSGGGQSGGSAVGGPFSGGGGGGAVSGNSNITWVATGTRLGGIS